MEMLDMDGPTQTMSSVDVRPQAMAPIASLSRRYEYQNIAGIVFGWCGTVVYWHFECCVAVWR